MTARNRADELERLRGEVERLELALRSARRELLDTRGRLALINRILADQDRCARTPVVTFGAVRAVLRAETPTLRRNQGRWPEH